MMEIILVLATIGQRFRLALAPNHTVSLMPAMSFTTPRWYSRAHSRDAKFGFVVVIRAYFVD